MSDEKKTDQPQTDNDSKDGGMPAILGTDDSPVGDRKPEPAQPVEPPPLPTKDTPVPEVRHDEDFDGFDEPTKTKPEEEPKKEPEAVGTPFPGLPPGVMGAAVLPIQDLFNRFRRGGRGRKKASPRVLMIAEMARAVRANAEAIKSLAEIIDGTDVDDGNTHIIIDSEIIEDLSNELKLAAAGFAAAMQSVHVASNEPVPSTQDSSDLEAISPEPEKTEGSE